jgi:PAS domain S-box-containing protein
MESWLFYALAAAAILAAVTLVSASKSSQARAARALRESERRYRDLFNSTSDALFIYDESGRVLDVNDRVCDLYRCTREQALTSSFRDRCVNVPPFTQADAEEKVRRAIHEGPQVFEWLARRHDETTFWSEVALHTCDIAGKKLVMASVRDFTERKLAAELLRRSEATLSVTVQMGKMGYWEFDPATGIVILNDQFFSIMRTTAAKAGGYRLAYADYLRLFVPPEDIPGIMAEAGPANDPANPRQDRYIERRALFGDGTHGHVSVRYLIDKDDRGRVTMIHGVVQDITELKTAEQEIRVLNEELEGRVRERTAQYKTANRELEAFSYSVSHDLRAPLRAIDGFTHILMEDHAPALDEEGRRLCRVIIDSTERMGRLIDDLLSFSRLNHAGMLSVPIDMTAMAESLLHDLVPAADRERTELRVGALPEAVGDPSFIRLAWQNLLSNAVKFSGKRERPAIEVGGRRDDGETVYWVRDNGAGFDMAYAGKLFNVFQRLHSESDYPGTGVGLAIVQRVIARHGGSIRAEGKPGVGATFTFTLPA